MSQATPQDVALDEATAAFTEWLRGPSRTPCRYFQGDMLMAPPEQKPLVGRAAWAAYTARQVLLVQRRNGAHDYSYYAMKRRRK